MGDIDIVEAIVKGAGERGFVVDQTALASILVMSARVIELGAPEATVTVTTIVTYPENDDETYHSGGTSGGTTTVELGVAPSGGESVEVDGGSAPGSKGGGDDDQDGDDRQPTTSGKIDWCAAHPDDSHCHYTQGGGNFDVGDPCSFLPVFCDFMLAVLAVDWIEPVVLETRALEFQSYLGGWPGDYR